MPIYEYQCPNCGHKFELRQGFDAESTSGCGVCGAAAQRRISLVPVIFKGKGWYVNDYGRGSPSTSKNRDSEDNSTSSETPKDGQGNSSDAVPKSPKETKSEPADSGSTSKNPE